MDFYSQLAHVQTYSQAFWAHEMIDRPFTCVRAPKYGPDHPRPAITLPRILQACKSGDYEPLLDDLLEWADSTWFGGEDIPHRDLSVGPDQYAALFGGEVAASSDQSTTWVLPYVPALEDFEPVPDLSESGLLAGLRRWLTAAAKRAEGHFLIDMLDLHGNMDALSAMRGAVGLCYDMMDCPEQVHRVLDGVEPAYRMLYDMAWDCCHMEQYGSVGWQPVYCQGKSTALQCDFTCVMSPEQGREFVFPKIEEEAAMMDHAMYHLDGRDALCHLDTLLDMPCIEFIQWVPGAGQPRTMEWMDVLKKIQASGRSVWIYDWTVEEIMALHRELEPDKVCYSVCAASPEEGEALLEFLVKNT